MSTHGKRTDGRYYTERNPFILRPFRQWASRHDIGSDIILEPFAGRNDLVQMLRYTGCGQRFKSYDILPKHPNVKRLNTMSRFPTGHRTCVTNPPWLGKYSAKRRGLAWRNIPYDDIYKFCLELALDNCENVAFIIPATFLHWWGGMSRQSRNSSQFERLESVTFLNSLMFDDTENPVCLALFGGKSARDVRLYYDNRFIGTYNKLRKYLPKRSDDMSIRFNSKHGKLGLVGIDNTTGPSIRFCRGSEIKSTIKHSSRSVTRIHYDATPSMIDELNRRFRRFRILTHDVFLTPFKGLRADGYYRRRLDYSLARDFISRYGR